MGRHKARQERTDSKHESGDKSRKRKYSPLPSNIRSPKQTRKIEKFKEKTKSSPVLSINEREIGGKQLLNQLPNESSRPGNDSNQNRSNSLVGHTRETNITNLDKRIVNLRNGKIISNPISTGADENPVYEAEADGLTLTVNAADEDEFGETEIDSDHDGPEYEEGELTDDEILQLTEQTEQAANDKEPEEEVLDYQDSEVCFHVKNNLTSGKIVNGPQNEQEAVQFLTENPHLNNLFKKMIKESLHEENLLEPKKGKKPK